MRPFQANKLLPQFSPPSTLVSNHLIFQKEQRTTQGCVVLFGAGDVLQTLHTSRAVKTYILTQKTPIFRRFCVIPYALPDHL